jgi:hypothetical protein
MAERKAREEAEKSEIEDMALTAGGRTSGALEQKKREFEECVKEREEEERQEAERERKEKEDMDLRPSTAPKDLKKLLNNLSAGETFLRSKMKTVVQDRQRSRREEAESREKAKKQALKHGREFINPEEHVAEPAAPRQGLGADSPGSPKRARESEPTLKKSAHFNDRGKRLPAPAAKVVNKPRTTVVTRNFVHGSAAAYQRERVHENSVDAYASVMKRGSKLRRAVRQVEGLNAKAHDAKAVIDRVEKWIPTELRDAKVAILQVRRAASAKMSRSCLQKGARAAQRPRSFGRSRATQRSSLALASSLAPSLPSLPNPNSPPLTPPAVRGEQAAEGPGGEHLHAGGLQEHDAPRPAPEFLDEAHARAQRGRGAPVRRGPGECEEQPSDYRPGDPQERGLRGHGHGWAHGRDGRGERRSLAR